MPSRSASSARSPTTVAPVSNNIRTWAPFTTASNAKLPSLARWAIASLGPLTVPSTAILADTPVGRCTLGMGIGMGGGGVATTTCSAGGGAAPQDARLAQAPHMHRLSGNRCHRFRTAWPVWADLPRPPAPARDTRIPGLKPGTPHQTR